VRCTGYSKGSDGKVSEVHCDYLPETKSGTPGADSVKTKGVIHWLSAAHALGREINLYDRLFREPHPGTGSHQYLDDINPSAKVVVTGYLEPSLADAKADERFQFERHGYFVLDKGDKYSVGQRFNRAVTLRDSWSQARP